MPGANKSGGGGVTLDRNHGRPHTGGGAESTPCPPSLPTRSQRPLATPGLHEGPGGSLQDSGGNCCLPVTSCISFLGLPSPSARAGWLQPQKCVPSQPWAPEA